jgi:hypothetical protein
MYYSLAALHVSSNIFAHNQEHLNCIYSFWYYMRMLLPVRIMGESELKFHLSHYTYRQQHTNEIPEAVNTVKWLNAPDNERKYCSKHVEQPRNNKLFYIVASC